MYRVLRQPDPVACASRGRWGGWMNIGVKEVYEMYVYIKSEPQLWTVGFYTPSGEWVSESDYECRDDAAERVHWLNGGGKPSDIIKDFFLDLSRMSGTGNGIGASTIAKLKAFAKEYGYL